MNTIRKTLWRSFPWLGWLVLLFFVISLIFIEYSSKTKFLNISEFLNGYEVKWSAFSTQLELTKDGIVLEKFKIPTRPLAIWYRPSTQSMAIITSEFANGTITDNHVLYIRKNGTLRKLYHSVVGFDVDRKQWLNSTLYQINGQIDEQRNAVYLTPNEEYLFAREYGYGYYPRVFLVENNGLIARQLDFEQENLHWSPTGRCLINIGETGQASWGYFQSSNDFVHYFASNIDLINIRDLQVWWKSEKPCEGYISMIADHFGGMGDLSQLNETYNYAIGEEKGSNDQIGVSRINSLPTDVESYDKSLIDDWQMIMVTKP